ncbi:MAG: hypothetical protein ACLUE2_14515 [Bacteroides cellulosilyticus]
MEGQRKLQTGYLAFDSDLIGKRMTDTRFRGKSTMWCWWPLPVKASVWKWSPREAVLQAGDTLLLEGKKLREEDFNGDVRFFDSENIQQVNHKTLVSSGIMLASDAPVGVPCDAAAECLFPSSVCHDTDTLLQHRAGT